MYIVHSTFNEAVFRVLQLMSDNGIGFRMKEMSTNLSGDGSSYDNFISILVNMKIIIFCCWVGGVILWHKFFVKNGNSFITFLCPFSGSNRRIDLKLQLSLKNFSTSTSLNRESAVTQPKPKKLIKNHSKKLASRKNTLTEKLSFN